MIFGSAHVTPFQFAEQALISLSFQLYKPC